MSMSNTVQLNEEKQKTKKKNVQLQTDMASFGSLSMTNFQYEVQNKQR